MPATREALEARWETPEGKKIAASVIAMLQDREMITDFLLPRVSALPFVEEVAPQLDLRGLHIPAQLANRYEDGVFHLEARDLAGTRFDYLRDVLNMGGRLESCIFDEMHCTCGIFSADFTGASFRFAHLQGVRFLNAVLHGANFYRARLLRADMSTASCVGASFIQADLRLSMCAHVDFREADLRGADLTGATLGGVVFDERTRLEGANLREASMDEKLRTFAQASGALMSEKEHGLSAYDLISLDALLGVVRDPVYNEDGHLNRVIPSLERIRERLMHDPSFRWEEALATDLQGEVSGEVIDELFDYLYPEALRLMPYYV